MSLLTLRIKRLSIKTKYQKTKSHRTVPTQNRLFIVQISLPISPEIHSRSRNMKGQVQFTKEHQNTQQLTVNSIFQNLIRQNTNHNTVHQSNSNPPRLMGLQNSKAPHSNHLNSHTSCRSISQSMSQTMTLSMNL